MPSPTTDPLKLKLAWIHAVRAELNRRRYLEALELPTHNDSVLRQLVSATKALDPGEPTSAISNKQ